MRREQCQLRARHKAIKYEDFLQLVSSIGRGAMMKVIFDSCCHIRQTVCIPGVSKILG